MSRTFRSCELAYRNWTYKQSPLRDWRAWAEAKVETEYEPRNRHLNPNILISSFEDYSPAALSEPYTTDLKRHLKLKQIETRN